MYSTQVLVNTPKTSPTAHLPLWMHVHWGLLIHRLPLREVSREFGRGLSECTYTPYYTQIAPEYSSNLSLPNMVSLQSSLIFTWQGSEVFVACRSYKRMMLSRSMWLAAENPGPAWGKDWGWLTLNPMYKQPHALHHIVSVDKTHQLQWERSR